MHISIRISQIQEIRDSDCCVSQQIIIGRGAVFFFLRIVKFEKSALRENVRIVKIDYLRGALVQNAYTNDFRRKIKGNPRKHVLKTSKFSRLRRANRKKTLFNGIHDNKLHYVLFLEVIRPKGGNFFELF